jgi:hypothetical protein
LAETGRAEEAVVALKIYCDYLKNQPEYLNAVELLAGLEKKI